MNDEPQWVNGMYPKPPHQDAKDFNIGKVSINLEQFMPWLREWCKANPGEQWINIEMNKNKADPTKGNAKVDTWKPSKAAPVKEQAKEGAFDDDPDLIPF